MIESPSPLCLRRALLKAGLFVCAAMVSSCNHFDPNSSRARYERLRTELNGELPGLIAEDNALASEEAELKKERDRLTLLRKHLDLKDPGAIDALNAQMVQFNTKSDSYTLRSRIAKTKQDTYDRKLAEARRLEAQP